MQHGDAAGKVDDSENAENAKNTTDAEMRENRENWDDRADVHAAGGYGDLDAFIADGSAITSVVRRDYEVLKPFLPGESVKGLSLLHLQCHIGTDTLSWERLGACDVHGLDFSARSLEHARSIAQRAGKQITYVESDARYAADALPGKHFDCIVTSAGTVTWLPTLGEWAQSIAKLLEPGGVFMIRDNHPLLFALDNSGMKIVESYCSGAEDSYETDQTYTMAPLTAGGSDGGAGSNGSGAGSANRASRPGTGSAPRITHTHNHNWAHDFQEMTGALLDAGLTIERLGEHEESDWCSMPMLEFDEARQSWRMPAGYPRLPLTFSIVARKPC